MGFRCLPLTSDGGRAARAGLPGPGELDFEKDDDNWISRFSDPGRYRDLLAALPANLPDLAAVVRNVLVHYRAAGITFTGDRLAEIDNRWVERILDTTSAGSAPSWWRPARWPERVAGCCRDFTLLTVAALRERGVPARSGVGFAGYFRPPFHDDQVIVEYWVGDR
jgi:hypothetical protein